MAGRRTIWHVREDWVKAKANLLSTTTDILLKHGEEIVDLNRNQLYHGLDGYGNQLQRYADAGKYNGYAAYKHKLNPTPGWGIPDLKLTGSTYEKMRLLINGRSMGIDSEDVKSAMLKTKYGAAIYRLSQESLNVVRKEILQPDLVINLAKQTGAQWA